MINSRTFALCIAAAFFHSECAQAKEHFIDWAIPKGGGSLPSETASVGDTVTFEWSASDNFNPHNVWIHPSGTCSFSDTIELSEFPPASYTFKETDIGKMTFACQKTQHCDYGQILTFTVTAVAPATKSPVPAVVAQTSAPTKAPVAATKAPVAVVVDEESVTAPTVDVAKDTLASNVTSSSGKTTLSFLAFAYIAVSHIIF